MDAWPRCLERLEAELPAEDIHTWLKPLQATQRDDKTVLYAPNAFVVEHVRERYLPRIRELLAYFAGSDEVSLEIGSLPRAAAPVPEAVATAFVAPVRATPSEPFNGHLDNHYTFENFVEGRSNQLGRAAAWKASLKPGDRAHNPLLLYGGTGLGKTHLMFAAGNAMRAANPNMRVLYLRSEQFFSAMMKSLQDKTMDAFKRQFQQVDALLIDDIQFFAGKDRTQEEFFHTFNALFDGKQQIILTCDRYPREVRMICCLPSNSALKVWKNSSWVRSLPAKNWMSSISSASTCWNWRLNASIVLSCSDFIIALKNCSLRR